MEKDLATRVQVLEDKDAIKKVKYQYCYYGDEDDLENLMKCFSEDCSVDLGFGRTASGKKDLTELFRKSHTFITFANHMVHNPIIEVDGDAATGIWYVQVPNTRNGIATWTQARYDEQYVRENGEWKIRHEKITMQFVTPYEAGWVKERFTEGLAEKYEALINGKA